MVKNGLVLADEQRTLAEALAARGFATAAVVSSFVLAAKFGYGQGFASYDDSFEREAATLPLDSFAGQPVTGGFDRRADRTTRLALARLEALAADRSRPFFLFVHYFDPHVPYEPPEEFLRRFPEPPHATPLDELVRGYDAEIAFADHEFGRLLDALDAAGLASQTLVVAIADHGEGLMQHGRLAHGVHIYEEAVRVPLIARWPGRIPAGRALAGPVSLVALAPAILSLLGGAGPDGWEPHAAQGRELAAVLRGERTLDPAQPIFLYRRHYAAQQVPPEGLWAEGEKFGVRIGDWKYIEGPAEGTYELFDLGHDPDEMRNLYAARPDELEPLARAVADWRRTLPEAGLAGTPSAEDRSRLEALGYTE